MITGEEFKRDVSNWAQRISVTPREIHIRKMTRKWGSCSTRGRLTFDSSLLMEEEEKRTRVIVEELLHLRYPNHGKMFNALLESYIQMYHDRNSLKGIFKGDKRSILRQESICKT
jgi:predicted metal-dependent hydrolase